MNKTLGARIAELRKEKGLTQEELAKQLGISIEALLTGEAETTYVPEEKRKSFEETIFIFM